ncbi:MAG: nucleic acid-binding protein [Methanoregulaceae archaeon]
MQFHYALVDDLVSREEFERRVEEKMQECGDLLDEVTAAMVVVYDLGREHVKVRDLSTGSTLSSFFGKVITISPPREFTRKDGDKGWVAHIIVGDETGQARAVLWDEKAAAVAEIEIGDVLEIIGKQGGRPGDVVVLALRKSPIEISCGTAVQPQYRPAERTDVEGIVLLLGEPRTIVRRDGSTGEIIEGCFYDGTSTARIVSWDPALLAGVQEGVCIRIGGVLLKQRTTGTEYVIDERSTISPASCTYSFRFSIPGDVREGGVFSIEGVVASVQPPRAFTTRDGRPGHVRNLVITASATDLRVVFWGDRALIPIVAGDRITIYQGSGRTGRDGGLELHVGAGGFVRVQPPSAGQEFEMDGTIIVTREGTFIDDGSERFLLSGEHPHGHEVRVRGFRSGDRITAVVVEEREPDPAAVRDRICTAAGMSADNTFTLHGRQDI